MGDSFEGDMLLCIWGLASSHCCFHQQRCRLVHRWKKDEAKARIDCNSKLKSLLNKLIRALRALTFLIILKCMP